jgi:hypothetical protein
VDAIDYYKSEVEKIGKEVSCGTCTNIDIHIHLKFCCDS